MWAHRAKLFMELTSRCLLLAVIDAVLAQRISMPKFFIHEGNAYISVCLIILWWFINGIALLIAFILIFLRTRHLKDSLSFLLCGILIHLSFSINEAFLQSYLADPATLWKYYYVCCFCMLQFTLATVYILLRTRAQSQRYGLFSYNYFTKHWSVLYHLMFLLTPIFYFVGLPLSQLEWLPYVSFIILNSELLVTLLLRLPHIINAFEKYITNMKMLLRHHGLQILIESHWVRLRVPTLLQTYWITKIVLEMLLLLVQERILDEDPEEINLSLYDLNITHDNVMLTLQTDINDNITERTTYMTLSYIANTTQSLLLKGCDGVIPLLGMTTIVSRVTHYVGLLMAVLVDSNSEEDKNMGTMCGILFFVLALQTGLTKLEPNKRLIRLYRNFCLLSTAILHFVHSMVHPLLMSISVSHATSRSKHIRVLSMCLFLLMFPACLLTYLWYGHTISPWLLAVTAFSIEVMIKVIISLLIYTLFMIDSHREVFWERLDDYIYYIKATGNTIEFLFGIFLFCNGAWIMLFESGGMIRAVMMCVHAYFNIWMQAREGWKVFIQRRSAVGKINSLPEATPEQLRAHNDICAICYQDLETARITRCRHFFHSVCLRKWLYHQDRCPLCHLSIYETATTSQDNNNEGNDLRQPVQVADAHQHQD